MKKTCSYINTFFNMSIKDLRGPYKNEYPAAEQRGINWNIHNRPKRRGINKPQAY